MSTSLAISDGTASRGVKRQTSAEQTTVSKKAKVAGTLDTDNTLEANAEETTHLSPRVSDPLSFSASLRTNSPLPIGSTEREHNTRPPSPEPTSNDQNPSISLFPAQNALHIPGFVPIRPHSSTAHSEALESSMRSTTDRLDQISADIDRLGVVSLSGMSGIQEEMERNRGEVASARGEVIAALEMARESGDQGL